MMRTVDVDARVREALRQLGIEHTMMECDPAFADTAAFCARYAVPPENSANTILVASKKEPKQVAACLVLANTRLDVNHAVSAALGVKRLSFASSEETVALTGMMVGGVTLFGLPDSIPILVDARVMRAEWVIVGGGSRSWKIRLAPAELNKIQGLRVIETLALPAATHQPPAV